MAEVLAPSLKLLCVATILFPQSSQCMSEAILAAVAQHEREMISERTRVALQAAKARGKKLGNPKLVLAQKRGTAAGKAAAAQFAANVLPLIREIQAAGAASANAIATKLNERR